MSDVDTRCQNASTSSNSSASRAGTAIETDCGSSRSPWHWSRWWWVWSTQSIRSTPSSSSRPSTSPAPKSTSSARLPLVSTYTAHVSTKRCTRGESVSSTRLHDRVEHIDQERRLVVALGPVADADDDEVLRRDHVAPVAAVAGEEEQVARHAREPTTCRVRPEPVRVRRPVRLRRGRRLFDPFSRDELRAVPLAGVEQKMADAREVAARHVQPGVGVRTGPEKPAPTLELPRRLDADAREQALLEILRELA